MQQVVSLCWSFIWSYNYYLQRTNLPLRGEIFCDIDYRPTAQLIMGQIDANDNDLISQFYGAIKMNWLKDLS